MIESRLSVDVFENEFEMGVMRTRENDTRHTTHDTRHIQQDSIDPDDGERHTVSRLRDASIHPYCMMPLSPLLLLLKAEIGRKNGQGRNRDNRLGVRYRKP
jgi:hypothetical protein